MKIQLLIATADSDFSELLSNTLSARYADTFEVGVCSSLEKLADILKVKKNDVALVEPEWAHVISGSNVKLTLALWSEQSSFAETVQNVIRVQKYQRISALVSDTLEHYSAVATGFEGLNKDRGRIVAAWSPAGGVGKTAVALAYATRCASTGKSVTYLDLEHFSSTNAFFSCEGKSISTLFEKLESSADILAKSIRQVDSGSGIGYFNPPNNYDDINELTSEDLVALANVCAAISDVVVIDLPCVCDKRAQAILELADTVLLVTDGSKITESKLGVFMSQHNVFEDIRNKTRLVSNKGAKLSDTRFEAVITLPLVQTNDFVSIYKTLSGNNSFGE